MGVSRTQMTSLYLSLRHTCAVRVMSVSPSPEAILPIVDVDAGSMTNASKRLDPDAIGAVRSSSEKLLFTYCFRSFSLIWTSSRRSILPQELTIRYLSAGHFFRKSTAYTAPEEPVMPTTIFIHTLR